MLDGVAELRCGYVSPPSSCAELSEALREKERRVQQQLERSADERGRKMEEQRRKEQQRRAAAEEKRRQQQEAEKVRGQSTLMMHLTSGKTERPLQTHI